MTNMLTATDINAWYGSAHVVFDGSVRVGAGEIVGLLGRNGAGKTSMLRAIMGVEVHRTGTVTLDGADVSSLSADRLARRGVGWVPDDRRLFPMLTVTENLRLSARRRDAQTPEELFDVFPLLEKLMGRRGSELSGGEQQVVAIARAIINRPRVLLLDEPSEGLAPIVVDQLRSIIKNLPERFGVSILVADENLSVALDLCSRVYVFDAGVIAYEGSAHEFADETELQNRYLAV